MKKRNPGIVLLLGFVTVFVYFFIWHFKFQDELREESGKGILPVGHLMILLLPVANIIYVVYWLCTVEGRLVFAGAPGKNRWYLMLFLGITVVGLFFVPSILQAKANKIGTAETLAELNKTKTDLRVDKYAKYK